MGERRGGEIKRISIPAKAGISRGGIVRHASPQATLVSASRKFPAFAGRDSRFRGNGRRGREWKKGAGMEDGAGMERGREWERGGNRKEIAAKIKRTSIPAKAGISAAKPHSPTGDQCNVPLCGKFSLLRE